MKHEVFLEILYGKDGPGEGDSEPPEVLPSPVFKTGTFDHSDISRTLKALWRRHPDSNRGIKALQASALATWLCRHNLILLRWCPGPDLNRHDCNSRGILSPLCLPFPPPGRILYVAKWSGKRDSNPRPQPWQGYALPLSYSRVILTLPKLNWDYIKLFFKCKGFFNIICQNM